MNSSMTLKRDETKEVKGLIIDLRNNQGAT